MKRALTVALLVLTAIPVLAAELPKEVAPRYAALLAAVRKTDQKAFATFFAREFVSVDPSGKATNRDAFMMEVSGLFQGAKSATTRFTCEKAARKGDRIAVDFDFHVTLHGKPGGDQEAHEVGTDFWKKTGGQWQIVKTVDKAFNVKPVAAKARKPGKNK